VSDFVRDVDYKAGEIVPHCGCTLDVFVGEGGSVTVSDKPVESACAFVEKLHASNGLTCYRLALGAGHRVMVQASWWQPIDSAPKDGTAVVLWAKDLRFPGNTCVAQYITHDIEWWHVTDGKFGPWPLRGPSPTHWKPLSNPLIEAGA
jgi:hypothetical protein